ncbi:MAG: bifunctional lysine-specific demethylase and histidyl-hydroxylase, partial [Solirubrobacteraceae bacterium]|nr:bifunctional lysine-specific demethylase and histidyl-hydroxylase [Solirubrobacteraceae bacterium]
PEELLERLAARLEPGAVARRARRSFVAGRRAILDGQLTQVRALEQLTLRSPLQRRETVIAELELDEAGATLLFEGKELRLPAQAVEALTAIHAARAPFTAAELPGPLDAAGGLVLVSRLVREGYLRLLDP